jgi:hypothetical protein
MTASPFVLLDDSLTPGGRSLLYTEPERIVAAHAPEEIDAALEEISAGLARGLHAAGFFAYELSYWLEPKLLDLLPAGRAVPLFWIACSEIPVPLTMPAPAPGWKQTARPSARRPRTSSCLGRARNTTARSLRSRTTSPRATSIRSISR